MLKLLIESELFHKCQSQNGVKRWSSRDPDHIISKPVYLIKV